MTITQTEQQIIDDVLNHNITQETLNSARQMQADNVPHKYTVIDALAGAKQLTDSLKEVCYDDLLVEIENDQMELEARRAATYRCLVRDNCGACTHKNARQQTQPGGQGEKLSD